ncbi:CD209 antigen-like protein C DC-SIGN-related protein 2 [Collichthys lucidus]|uniref:CD209 antigen-like protein C DC-SIGN-related protein 2 n=1 Tax=Collichthys lucidus TaxID=240159 RepID=A0A4U5U799_COLLU|nr:CD209 antigen-like protein C DC-SIGN-related protein 2 [Collichthys lucidus]
MENIQLKQLLNSTYQNLTLLGTENNQLKLHLTATLDNFTLLSAENTQLNLHLKDMSQENAQLNLLLKNTMQENTQLNLLLKNTMQENTQLNLLLNKTSQENTQLNLLLKNVLEKNAQLNLLLVDTSQENTQLNLLLNKTSKENTQLMSGRQNPSEDLHSAWIGLQDIVTEGTFFWVNGDTVKWDVIYWMDQEPNNAMADWDTSQIGQDCVAIVPPTRTGAEDWLNNWDDIICNGRRHYICETTALVLG